MRIDPLLPPSGFGVSPLTSTTGPELDFAELLDDKLAPPQAVEFQAYGLCGARPALFPDPAQAPASASAVDPAASLPEGTRVAAPPLAGAPAIALPRTAIVAAVANDAAPSPLDAPRATLARFAVDAARAEQPALAPPPPIPSDVADLDGSEPATGHPRSPQSRPVRQLSSLILTEADGRLTVIAAASLDASEAQRLRGLIADTASAFGLDLDNIQINGRPAPVVKGAPSGSRAR